MAGTKVTVLNDGSVRIEGDFEILDPEGKAFGLAGRTAISFAAAAIRRTSRSATDLTRHPASKAKFMRENCRHPSPKSEQARFESDFLFAS